jgi:hypothetical protein
MNSITSQNACILSEIYILRRKSMSYLRGQIEYHMGFRVTSRQERKDFYTRNRDSKRQPPHPGTINIHLKK